jgi:hypothetical protein
MNDDLIEAVPDHQPMNLDVPYSEQETEDSCAAACLLSAVRYRFPELDISETDLRQKCHCLPGEGTIPRDGLAAARHYEPRARWLEETKIEAEVETALLERAPVLANVELRGLPYAPKPPAGREYWHSVLIVGLDAEHVYLHDPDPAHGGPRRTVDRKAFFSGWPQHGHSAYRV